MKKYNGGEQMEKKLLSSEKVVIIVPFCGNSSVVEYNLAK